MATSESRFNDADPGSRHAGDSAGKGRSDVREASTQTDAKVQGHGPRLSKVNLFTLLSLWMELFPRKEKETFPTQTERWQVRSTGLVVVQGRSVTGLHCSSRDLHAGQIAVLKHGPRLRGCDLYFSRKPCSTCLKMIINAGVHQISYWPGDPEMSLLTGSGDSSHDCSSQEAVLDARAAERLKSNSRPHICVLLQALPSGMQQFVEETSKDCDFLGRIAQDDRCLDVGGLFREEQKRNLGDFNTAFFVQDQSEHRGILTKMGLENFCIEPYFSNLRQNMRNLITVLASVASSLLDHGQRYGFYGNGPADPGRPLSQVIAKHCIIQAQLLAYRTEDPKVGVGAVIWAEGKSGNCDGTGHMYLVGSGYNAYPVGSEYAELPQMDDKQQDRHSRKYRYIIHAEQNALTFRCAELREDENTTIFVTKCPCDECVPLIKGAGVKQIYTSDMDSGKDKHDISYLQFDNLQGVQKFVWQRNSQVCPGQLNSCLSNGCMGKHNRESEEDHPLLRYLGYLRSVGIMLRNRLQCIVKWILQKSQSRQTSGTKGCTLSVCTRHMFILSHKTNMNVSLSAFKHFYSTRLRTRLSHQLI
ncbi:cytidine and dCMP deaminase domain-containing protein 1 isoform X1 [Paramormyrops kingsleyae]|uniref:cytidine and dCMP deaminase domain-containing protein 1 isoform X1 n=1 Tax=Paramormyrops kingsleyae TaxID=1676925 RepID=UPI003B96A775